MAEAHDPPVPFLQCFLLVTCLDLDQGAHQAELEVYWRQEPWEWARVYCDVLRPVKGNAMFCPNCGAKTTGNFCAECGHALKSETVGPGELPQDWAQHIIGKRLCNALIRDAEPDFGAFFAIADLVGLGTAKNSVNAVSSLAKKLMGGLWVGGTTYLTKDSIVFRPNFLNRLVHKDDYSVRIPLGEIIDVKKRFGIGTQIIEIKTSKGTLSIRCYWPTSFIEMIDNARSGSYLRTASP
jgi:hypothetical protein